MKEYAFKLKMWNGSEYVYASIVITATSRKAAKAALDRYSLTTVK